MLSGRVFGTIPSELGNLVSLAHLSFENNLGLEGTVPTELARLTNLRGLSLSSTSLSGTMPEGVCALRSSLLVELTAPCTRGIECSCCSSCT